MGKHNCLKSYIFYALLALTCMFALSCKRAETREDSEVPFNVSDANSESTYEFHVNKRRTSVILLGMSCDGRADCDALRCMLEGDAHCENREQADVPIQVSLSISDGSGRVETINVTAQGLYASAIQKGYKGKMYRLLASRPLDPGEYKITVRTVTPNPLFSGRGCTVSAGLMVKSIPQR